MSATTTKGSDSDIEEEQEEEEPELEEEEEEEEEEENEGGEDGDSDDRNDSSPEIESEEYGGDLKSEKSNSATHKLEDKGDQWRSSNPSTELLAAQRVKVSDLKDQDSKDHSPDKDLAPSKDNGFLEHMATNDKVFGAQSEKKSSTGVSGNAELPNMDLNGTEPSNKVVGAINTRSSSCNEKEVAAKILVRSGQKVSTSVQYSKGKTRQSGEKVKQRESSLITPQIRPRTLSPADFEEKNKRPALLCDFYAKGWCIKGSSCKFLHQKDGVDYSAKGDQAADSMKDEPPDDAGLRRKAEKSSVLSPDPLSSSALRSQFSSERTLSREHRKNLNHRFNHMDDTRSGSEELATGLSLSRNTSAPDYLFFSRGSAVSSPYSHTSLEFNNSLNSSFNSSHSRTGIPPLERDRGYIGHRTQAVAYNWEPSVPFKPSFDIGSIISSTRTQYDPLLDSIELPNVGDRSFQSYSANQGTIVQNKSHQRANGDSISFDQKPEGNVSDSIMYTSDEVEYRTAAEAAGVAGRQLISPMPGAEKPLKHDPVTITSNANEIGFDYNPGQIDEATLHKESKTLKVFRASLVDVVKELVRPSWRDGHLSKDAHKLVVKKAVEKVLRTLQPHQIPFTPESTDQYLASSRPKLTKLVEGYVIKYGKP